MTFTNFNLSAKSREYFVRLLTSTTSGVVFLRLFSALLAVSLNIFLARQLGDTDFGEYTVFWSLITLTSIPATLGFGRHLVRRIAALQKQHNVLALNQLTTVASRTVTLSGTAIGLIWYYGIYQVAKWQFGLEATTAAIAAASIPIYGLLRTRMGVLEGFNSLLPSQSLDNAVRPLVFTAALLLVWAYLPQSLTPSLTALAQALALVCSLFCGYIITNKTSDKTTNLDITPPSNPTAISFSYHEIRAAAPLTLFQLLNIAGAHIHIVILGEFTDTASAAQYRIATQLATAIPFILYAANRVASPKISEYYSTDNYDKLETLTSRVTLLSAIPALIGCAIYLIYNEPIIRLFYGTSYLAAAPVLSIIACGQLFTVITGPVATLLIMTNHDTIVIRTQILAVIINLLLAFTLIPTYGAIGAAIAFSVQAAIWNALLAYYVHDTLNLRAPLGSSYLYKLFTTR